MVWYKYLYAEEDLRPKQEKIKWKILHNAGQVHMYVIALSRSPGGLLEIISTVELMQRAYPKERLFIVGLARGYENACKLAFPQVAGQLVVAAPAAWAFSKLEFPGRRVLYGAYLVLMVLPFQITMVPNYLVLDRLGLMDTPWAVILPGVFSAFPVFIIKKGFDAVPQSLLEAAALDGAGPLRCFVSVGLPLGLPAVLSAAILGFIEAWNAIEQPMLFLKDKANWPLSLYLSNITAGDLGLAMVASLMMLAPPLLLFLTGRKYLEQGIGLAASINEGM